MRRLLPVAIGLAGLCFGLWYYGGGKSPRPAAEPAPAVVAAIREASAAASADPTRVKIAFTGGHETDPADGGRPVILIAGALGVAPEVFRDAFSGVQPARGPMGPTPGRARANKEVLMAALGPHGITNERLDEVSNYYRYRPEAGELWPTRPAEGYATIGPKGNVMTFAIIDGGSGYSSPPTARIPGHPEVDADVRLAYGPDFASNGSVAGIELK